MNVKERDKVCVRGVLLLDRVVVCVCVADGIELRCQSAIK